MFGVIFFTVFAVFCVFLLAGSIILALVGNGYTSGDKRRNATDYAEWLSAAYPNMSVVEAAKLRLSEIETSSYILSEKQRVESMCALWVIQGWHLR